MPKPRRENGQSDKQLKDKQGMNTKNLFFALSIAVAAMIVAACSNAEDVTVKPSDETPAEARTWQVTINVGPAETRAISVGGNTGTKLYTNWDTGDVVEVVKDGAVVGTLTATASTANTAFAVLTGTLEGTFAVDDVLTLCYHSASFDYTGQVGTLAGVSTNKSFLTATSTVTAINVAESDINSSGTSGKLTMTDAAFLPQQSYLELSFTDESGNSIDITSLDVWTDGGKLVKGKAIDGSTTYATEASPLTITPATATNKFFLALRDENGAANNYHFKATNSSGMEFSYEGSKNPENGHYYTGSVAMTLSLGVGMFLNKDGSFTTTKQTSGTNESYAIVAYVGRVNQYFDKFLAIALEDVSSTSLSWGDANTSLGTFASSHPITYCGTTYNTSAINYNSSSIFPGSYDYFYTGYASQSREDGYVLKGWRIPSVTDWRYIFQGGLCNGPSATSPNYIKNYETYGNGSTLSSAINTACGNGNDILKNGGYWTSSAEEYDPDYILWWYYDFNSSYFIYDRLVSVFEDEYDYTSLYARPVFAY